MPTSLPITVPHIINRLQRSKKLSLRIYRESIQSFCTTVVIYQSPKQSVFFSFVLYSN